MSTGERHQLVPMEAVGEEAEKHLLQIVDKFMEHKEQVSTVIEKTEEMQNELKTKYGAMLTLISKHENEQVSN